MAKTTQTRPVASNDTTKPVHLDISQGTAIIHPNTGIRKSWSVGCTQSMEHSSGMWYDGREHPSGSLEHVEFEDPEAVDHDDVFDDDACCGRDSSDQAGYLCYYDCVNQQAYYADSDAVYSDEDEADGGSFDGVDDEDAEDSDCDDGAVYMRQVPRRAATADSSSSSQTQSDAAPGGEELATGAVDAKDLSRRLAALQTKE